MGVPSFGKGFFWALFNTGLSDFVDTKKRLPFNYRRVHSFCQIYPHNWFNVNFLIGKVLEVFCFLMPLLSKKVLKEDFLTASFSHATYTFMTNLHSVISWTSTNPSLKAGTNFSQKYFVILEKLCDCNWNRIHNHLVHKQQTLSHLPKLVEWVFRNWVAVGSVTFAGIYIHPLSGLR